ncbi:hypothetical protein [Achromobacter xylosoxidans]|uniref:hypothetical protein n=1 Tax=Alcaligenes xylosoxydans xylosoxydans TaxID=85698 RepID=UPI0011D2897F|nr:hypothetical protein [Achromobacter xylosoxidans]
MSQVLGRIFLNLGQLETIGILVHEADKWAVEPLRLRGLSRRACKYAACGLPPSIVQAACPALVEV